MFFLMLLSHLPYAQDLDLAGVAEAFDEVAIAMGATIEELANTRSPQLRLIDVYTLFAVSFSLAI